MRNAARTGGGPLRPRSRTTARTAAVAAAAALSLILTGCFAPAPERSPLPSTPPGTPSPTPTAAAPTPTGPPPVLLPAGGVEVVAQGLQAPWSILRLPTGGVLVSERDTANVVEVLGDGSLRVAATVPGVVPGGEGGLIGSRIPPRRRRRGRHTSTRTSPRHPTTASCGCRSPAPPARSVSGRPRTCSRASPKAGNHNGGRIAFGPDGFLYATAGDAGNRDAAQDPGSLSGKILRMTPEGRRGAGQPVRQPHVVVRAPQPAGARMGRRRATCGRRSSARTRGTS